MKMFRQLCSRSLNWIRYHRVQTIIGIGVILITIASGVAYAILSRPLPKLEPLPVSTVKAPEPVIYYSPLTGVKVKNEAAQTKPVTAIMIENSPSARPQSGLKAAGVVYEAVAEGGITRFVAIYQEAKPQLIGPVRSLRPYFLEWAEPYNGSIAHVGGSYEALVEVRDGTHRDIDQFFNAGTYWRSSDRYAPHNVYTSFKRLDALNKSKGYTTSKFSGFPRDDIKPIAKPTASKITLRISGETYNPSYLYDKKQDVYLRSLGGAAHIDRERGRIAPKVVIAMLVKQRTMSDGLHQTIVTAGSGRAYVFQGGRAITATWYKKNSRSQLVFKDSKGDEIPLARGQTWISAVPNEKGRVSWK